MGKRSYKVHMPTDRPQTVGDLEDAVIQATAALGSEAEIQFVRITMKGKINFIEFVLED